MKSISKKIIIYLCIGFLTFSSVSITYYRSVHAIEWVEIGISTAEALKWLLGAMGIIGTAGAIGDNYFWNDKQEEFVDWYENAIEYDSGPNVRLWLEKLAKGTLDKGSACWDAFKEWASNLSNDINSGSSSLESPVVPSNPPIGTVANFTFDFGASPNDVLTACATANNVSSYTPFPSSLTENPDYSNVYYCNYYYGSIGSSVSRNLYMVTDNVPINYSNDYLTSNTNFHVIFYSFYANGYSTYYDSEVYMPPNPRIRDVFLTSNFNVLSDSGNFVKGVINFTGVGSGAGSIENLDSISIARQNEFDLVSRLYGDEVSDEVAIPLPGVDSGDDAISIDTYDGIIERVNEGEISIDDAVDEIQNILKVLVYDTTNDDVIPIKPDSEDPNENQNKDDALEESKENMGFTLSGLENVFPFCIPWDLFAFMNLLKADPQIPVFNVPFPNVEDPVHPVFVVVDLTPWDGFMRFLRLGMDLLFIVGLAVATRSLIGAGGD